jgi:uncharacterized protein (DUF1330 family)
MTGSKRFIVFGLPNSGKTGRRMMGHTAFSKEAFASFRANDRVGPIQMLNLIKLHDVVRYENGDQTSGIEAYAAYGRISAPVFAALGGKIIWRGRWEFGLIGPTDESWDVCFIAEYPSVASFVEMSKNPVYRQAVAHRTAAVRDSRLIRLAPAAAGNMFSG